MMTSDTGTSARPSSRSLSACLRSSATSLGVIWMRHAYSVLPNDDSYWNCVAGCGSP